MSKIDTYSLYKSEILEPDLQDFITDRRNLRKAWHSAISLFHLHDWVYRAHKTTIDASYSYRHDNGSSTPVSRAEHFANFLGQRYSDFQIIRGVANSSKHLELWAAPPGRKDPPGMPSNAANTYTSSGDFSTDFSRDFDTGEVMIEASPNPIPFARLAQSVLDMWNDIFNAEGW
jgi:hypothetical protein